MLDPNKLQDYIGIIGKDPKSGPEVAKLWRGWRVIGWCAVSMSLGGACGALANIGAL